MIIGKQGVNPSRCRRCISCKKLHKPLWLHMGRRSILKQLEPEDLPDNYSYSILWQLSVLRSMVTVRKMSWKDSSFRSAARVYGVIIAAVFFFLKK